MKKKILYCILDKLFNSVAKNKIADLGLRQFFNAVTSDKATKL